jgi:uncharacterized protein YjbJ (UPF0337 family)
LVLANWCQDCGASSESCKVPLAQREEQAKDWERIKEDWKKFRLKAQQKWDRLTDGDLNLINGRRDRLEAKIQQRYGFAPDQIRKEVDDWFRCADLVGPGRSVLEAMGLPEGAP